MRSRAAVWGLWIFTAALTAWGIAAVARRGVVPTLVGSDAAVESEQRLLGARLPDVRLRLLDEADENLELRALPAGHPHVFVVLTQADCYNRLADVGFWSSLERQLGAGAAAMVIAAGERPDILQYHLSHQGIALPVLFDSTSAVASLLASQGMLTPAVVLTTDEGIIRGVYTGTNGDLQVQAAHVRSMEALLAGARREAVSAPKKGLP